MGLKLLSLEGLVRTKIQQTITLRTGSCSIIRGIERLFLPPSRRKRIPSCMRQNCGRSHGAEDNEDNIFGTRRRKRLVRYTSFLHLQPPCVATGPKNDGPLQDIDIILGHYKPRCNIHKVRAWSWSFVARPSHLNSILIIPSFAIANRVVVDPRLAQPPALVTAR